MDDILKSVPRNLQADLSKQISNGANPEFAFLHVGKTAGTSIRKLITGLRKSGYQAPLYLSHGWDEDSLSLLKDTRLHIVLRDPIERAVSGFNSRLRRGRPAYEIPWTQSEAAVFSYFRNAQSFLNGILSEDPVDAGMAEFAMTQVRHIRRGYNFYLGASEDTVLMPEQFGIIGRFEALGDFAERISRVAGAPPGYGLQQLKSSHAANQSISNPVAGYNSGDQARLRSYFETEYVLYNRIVNLDKATADVPADG